jgi:hypothetical protein
MLNDTYDFVNKIGDLKTESDPYMVSFDVESLFSNVPTKKTIDIIWDVENIILPFSYNLEFMFLGHFSFVL